MLLGNLADRSISVALERTFDGQHPCPLCSAIAKGRAEERQKGSSTLPVSLKKIEILNQAGVLYVSPRASYPQISGIKALPGRLADAPPTPPPRST
jgi:hypothetical protein